MSLFPLLRLEEHHELAELVAPVWVFPVIAAVAFLVLGVVSWSYRDVYHRHADKTDGAQPDAHH